MKCLPIFLLLLSFSAGAGSFVHSWSYSQQVSTRPISVQTDSSHFSGGVKGDGDLTSSHRQLDPFDAIELEIPAQLVYRPSGDAKLQLIADSNLHDIVETQVIGGTLRINATQGFSTAQKITIEVGSPSLIAAVLRGSGALTVEQAEGDSLQLAVLGTGVITVIGQYHSIEAGIQGSGVIDSSALKARSCRLVVQGTGRIRSHCDIELNASVLGSGDIQVLGSPRVKRLSNIGSGRIHLR